jgi:hypothetical protein
MRYKKIRTEKYLISSDSLNSQNKRGELIAVGYRVEKLS